MKRYLCMVLSILLLILGSGCRKNSESFKDPVNFYYKNAADAFFEDDCVIASEIRETAEQNSNIVDILNLYLSGPLSDKLSSPFPANLKVISTEKTDSSFTVIFSKQFSTLSGLDLTIACSCICATVAELTGCTTVEIQSEGKLPDNASSLIFSWDQLLFVDSVTE